MYTLELRPQYMVPTHSVELTITFLYTFLYVQLTHIVRLLYGIISQTTMVAVITTLSEPKMLLGQIPATGRVKSQVKMTLFSLLQIAKLMTMSPLAMLES